MKVRGYITSKIRIILGVSEIYTLLNKLNNLFLTLFYIDYQFIIFFGSMRLKNAPFFSMSSILDPDSIISPESKT